ncbi:MAG TPA: hypothetical protein VF377_08895 [Acidimicrobiia bacterium]
MSQAFLGANPGTVVTDALAPTLMEAETVNGETTTGAWVEVGFPGDCVVVLELGSMAAAASLDVEIQGSDDGDDVSPEGLVSFGHFDTVGGSDDNEVRILDIQCYKRYVRAVATESGAADAVVSKITLAPPQFRMGNERTA